MRASRTDRGDRGQSLVEFAIVSLPLALLLLAILQFAFIYNAQIGLTNAVRDAARYGSTLVATDDTSAATAATRTDDFLVASLGKYVSPYYASRVQPGTKACYSPYTDPTGQQSVKVTVTAAYSHPLIVPLVATILDMIDGSNDGGFLMSSTIDLRVDNPLKPIPSLTGTACSS